VITLRLSTRVDTCGSLLGHGVSGAKAVDALLKLDADRSSLQASSIRNRTSDVLRTSSQSSTG
jgi:hypothetical protein